MQEDFKIFGWLVKPQTNELIGAEQTLKLDHKVMQLLIYLVQNAGKDLSKEDILRAVWGEGVFTEEVLTVAVSACAKPSAIILAHPSISKPCRALVIAC